jgi:tetratricopeptide (TPR) repeat protein
MKWLWIIVIFFLVGCSPLRSEFYRNQADFLYEGANKAYSAGQYDEARKGYHEVIALDPAYCEAYVGLGHCAMLQNHRKEALAFYEQAIALNSGLRPKLQELIFAASLGEQSAPKTFAAHQLEEQFNRGRYRQIIAERKGKGPLIEADYFWLIRSLVRLKDYQGAAAVVRRLVADQAGQGQAIEQMGHLDSFLSQGHAKALADFQTLADKNPGNKACQYLYGIFLFNNSAQYDEVIRIFEGLRKAGYAPRPLLAALAMTYEKSDRVIEAIEAYKRLGDDLVAYQRLRQLYVKLGDREEAQRYDELARQRLTR